MIAILKGFPEDVLAARATGRITKEDYKNILLPEAEKAFKAHEKLRVYYEIGPDFSGMDAGAMWEDFSLGFGHLFKWGRIAVVTDIGWIRNSVNVMRVFIPCPVKNFPSAEKEKAQKWLLSEQK